MAGAASTRGTEVKDLRDTILRWPSFYSTQEQKFLTFIIFQNYRTFWFNFFLLLC